jgi:hypothetical protein
VPEALLLLLQPAARALHGELVRAALALQRVKGVGLFLPLPCHACLRLLPRAKGGADRVRLLHQRFDRGQLGARASPATAAAPSGAPSAHQRRVHCLKLLLLLLDRRVVEPHLLDQLLRIRAGPPP